MLSMPRIVRPDPLLETGFPVEPATRRFIKRNKELPKPSDWEFLASSKSQCPIYSFHDRTSPARNFVSLKRHWRMQQVEPPCFCIAMWSGPRNISTAMMRAWENREDTFVVDEPFYAFYLKNTGADHPGAAEVIAAGKTDWRKIVKQCGRGLRLQRRSQAAAAAPTGKKIFYQKQMTHHLLPEVSRDWLREVTNCFLIRDPAEVIASYIRKNREPTVEDIGFVQQKEIFDFVRQQTGAVPTVIDAEDVLRDPERMLRLLCAAIGVEFSDAMLSWPPGPRETDGVWAKYWYTEVERSTSFAPYRERKIEVPKSLHEVHARCREIYEELYQHRLH